MMLVLLLMCKITDLANFYYWLFTADRVCGGVFHSSMECFIKKKSRIWQDQLEQLSKGITEISSGHYYEPADIESEDALKYPRAKGRSIRADRTGNGNCDRGAYQERAHESGTGGDVL